MGIRSLYTGSNGMAAESTKMGVISDNIANSSTTAYKSKRVAFANTLVQTIQNASSPSGSLGGKNALSIGNGVDVASIDTDITQGTPQKTNVKTDMEVDGNGYFLVSRVSDNKGDTLAKKPTIDEKYYTRDGSFHLDMQGNLNNADQYQVMGTRIGETNVAVGDLIAPQDKVIQYDTTNNKWIANIDNYKTFTTPGGVAMTEQTIANSTSITNNSGDTNNSDLTKMNLYNIVIPQEAQMTVSGKVVTYQLTDYSIAADGTIKALYGDNTVYLGRIAVANFQNNEGLTDKGGNLYSESSNSGKVHIGDANDSGYGKINQGTLEMSNVDIAKEFTNMIETSRAFQANARVITTSDELLQEIVGLKR